MRAAPLLLLCACGRIDFDQVFGPPHRFLYSGTGELVLGFELDQESGFPTPLPSSALPSGSNAKAIAIEHSQRFAYVVDGFGEQVVSFAIDPVTGALSQIGVVSGLVKPSAAAVDGDHLYVVNDLAESIEQFSIDPATGNLTSLGTFATGFTDPYPSNHLMSDGAGHLYMACNDNSGGVAGFAIGADGRLGSLPGSPWYLAPGAGPDTYQVALHPNGQWLFASDEGNGKVLWADYDAATGALAPHPSQLAVGFGLTFGLAFDAAGTHGYLADCSGGDRIYVISIDPVTGAQSKLGMGPATSCPNAVWVDTAHQLLLVGDEGDGLYTYGLQADGTIAAPAISFWPGAVVTLFAFADTRG